ncbi:MAG: hypothetical protein HY898_01695 [Deltaproteobacteria bacterium]|nr:hypothetical protein [Deltaproteobacteria bacterium]
MSGRIVTRGSIRVDARKAVEQLRNHLLIDLHLYASEAVRFAVAGGARRIDATHGRDEVVLRWDGEPIAPEGLPQLFDSLLAPSADPVSRRTRLLALAVNAALGLDPVFVEVHSADGTRCVSVRWTPDMLERGENPQPQDVALPQGMPARGMQLELRRGFRWRNLFDAGIGSIPRELQALATTSHLLGDALVLAGAGFPREPRAAPLLRVPFELAGASRAWVEILPHDQGTPTLELHELGIRLVSYRWRPTPPFPADPFAGCELPVRVVVDSPSLETNASRSALRENAAMLGELQSAANDAFLRAIQALVARVSGQPGTQPRVDILCTDDGKLQDALGAIVCVVAGGDRNHSVLDLTPLLSLTLLRDATGRPLSVLPFANARPAKVHVWRGKEALAEELVPWMAGTLWLRGRTIERLLTGAELIDAQPLADRARAAWERRKRFLALQPVANLIEPSPKILAREAFDLPDEEWRGLRGEVAVLEPGASREGATFRIMLEGRRFQSITLAANVVPLALEAAFEWEGRVRPRFDYDAVEPDFALSGAMWVAIVMGVRMANDLAPTLPNLDEKAAESLRLVLRSAIGTLVRCGNRLGIEERVVEPTLASMTGLWTAKVWPLSSGAFASVEEIAAFTDRSQAVCVAPAKARGVAPDGRPVVTCAGVQLAWLLNAFGSGVATVPYERALLPVGMDEPRRVALRQSRVDEEIERALEAASGQLRISMRCVFGTAVATIVIHPQPTLIRMHAGRVVARSSQDSLLAPVLLAIDDARIVPNQTWDGISYPGDEPRAHEQLEWQFARAVVSALEGAPLEGFPVDGLPQRPEDSDPVLATWLLRTLEGLQSFKGEETQQLRDRIARLPVLRMLDSQGVPIAASLADVRLHYPAPARVPVLASPPGFPTGSWRPVIVADEPLRFALSQALGSALEDGSSRVREQFERAEQEKAWLADMKGPALDPRAVQGVSDPSLPCVFAEFPATAGEPASNVAAGVASEGPTRVRILFRQRLVADVVWDDWPEPLALTVNLLDRGHLRTPTELSAIGVSSVVAMAFRGRALLAIELVLRAQGAGSCAKLFGSTAALSIVAAAVQRPSVRDADLGLRLGNELRDPSFHWPTVRCTEVPFEQLRTGEGGLYYGRIRYESWQNSAAAASEFDSPIAYVPPTTEGKMALSLLAWLAGAVRDVTDLLSMLQARRSGDPTQAPRIVAPPQFPLLRRSLEELEVRSCKGELEILEGKQSEVTLNGLDGRPVAVPAVLPIPARVVASVDAMLTEELNRRVLEDVTRAARRLLRSLEERLDELPDFVRAHLRKLVCVGIARGRKLPKRDTQLPVFRDIRGQWRSAEELAARTEPWLYTTDPPPYPSRDYRAAVLCLTEEEAVAMGKTTTLKNYDQVVRQDREAELRRNAPALRVVELDSASRAKCIHVLRVDEQGFTGEIGLLRPETSSQRGIHVHVGKRPLCVIADGPGWPLCAAINNDDLAPNRYFDGLRTSRDRTRVNEKVRALASALAREWWCASRPPPHRFVDSTVCQKDAGSPVSILGVFWLPPTWPRAPQVTVRSSVRALPKTGPVCIRSSTPGIEASLPMSGDLYVCHAPDAAKNQTDDGLAQLEADALSTVALRALQEMLDEVKSSFEPSELDAWYWNLALLGLDAPPLAAPCVNGASISSADLLDRLRHEQPVVLATHASLEAQALPAPVLLDDGGGWVRVLRCRARGVLRFAESDAGRKHDVLAEPVQHESSWLDRIVDKLSDVFASELADGQFDPALIASVHDAVRGLRLTGDPVKRIRVVGRGRPVRFRASDGTLFIHPTHPSLRPRSKAPAHASLIFLVAAAVTEINRELAGVTDAEERRALLHLLERMPAGGTPPAQDAPVQPIPVAPPPAP